MKTAKPLVQMNKPKVSIFIACWGYGQYLEAAINSALKQTVPCEVVVFDNASKDCTKSVIAKYDNIKKLSSGRLIKWTPLLNKLISENGREFILILGADDTIEPTFVEKCLSKMTKGVGVVRTGIQGFGEDTTTNIQKNEVTALELDIRNTIPITSLFRKKCWEDAGGFDEKVPGYEDWDFWIRVMRAGWQVASVKEALFNYNFHSDSGFYDQFERIDHRIKAYINKKSEAYHKSNGTYDEWMQSKELFIAKENIEHLETQLEEEKRINVLLRDEIESKVAILKEIESSPTWKAGSFVSKVFHTLKGDFGIWKK